MTKSQWVILEKIIARLEKLQNAVTLDRQDEIRLQDAKDKLVKVWSNFESDAAPPSGPKE